MGESGFRSAMAAMFQPKKPGQNLLRKAYINYYHRFKLNGMELPERTLKDIASRMRHTLEVARGSYRKINLAEEDDGLDVITTPTEAKATHPAVETMSEEHKATSANHKVVTPRKPYFNAATKPSTVWLTLGRSRGNAMDTTRRTSMRYCARKC